MRREKKTRISGRFNPGADFCISRTGQRVAIQYASAEGSQRRKIGRVTGYDQQDRVIYIDDQAIEADAIQQARIYRQA